MAKTVTTATDNGRDVPDPKALDALAEKVRAFRAKTWAVADALCVAIPRTVAHWRHRSEVDADGVPVHVKEGDIFADLAERCDEGTGTLKWWRNTAATFPKAMRADGITISVYKPVVALAWANDGARRKVLCEGVNETRPTVRQAEDHAKAMRLKDSPPTDPPADGEVDMDCTAEIMAGILSASDVNGPAVTTCTGDELVGMVFASVAAHDGSDASEPSAAIRCVSMLADALGVSVQEGATV